MFYRPGVTDHGLPYDPFKACVVPRPIGWITTLNNDGSTNLAPYSQFNNINFDPPMVMFSSNQTPEGSRKDTVINIERQGEFTWSLATWDLREQVHISSAAVPYGRDEYDIAKLSREAGQTLKTPMVAESPVKFECKYHSTIRIPGKGAMGTVDIIIGEVVGVHISDSVLTDGKLDILKTKPIARCGYYQYAVISGTDQVFDMIPDDPRMRSGLEGSVKANRAMLNAQ
ncbi:hypothetical protein GYMLUDRAFT_48884 [Collybiopsis luxurians FD-317 M1]|uniref:Flavin reductase like domain-containing protein n=1 Tax=Collybiopsis luxurians FD-317 M1 TaxID=944289 RepID=A0A0D0BWV4_9AGAR|nr:hypothetical protein GYMLUDRAFT_48884 [Collybiopsis luxurians FD-317 M1]